MGATIRDFAAAEGDPRDRGLLRAARQRARERHGGQPIRVEIPPTGAAGIVYVAQHYRSPAAGCGRSESDDFDLFTKGNLTRPAYAKWLREHGVDYVAVPDTWLDYLADDEAALIRTGGLPYLREVWTNQDWHLYRVRGAVGLVSTTGEPVRARRPSRPPHLRRRRGLRLHRAGRRHVPRRASTTRPTGP